MKVDIINTNYIFDHKLFKFWKVLIIAYGCYLIYYTSTNNTEGLLLHKNTIKLASTLFIGCSLLLGILNLFVFNRIGKLTINDNLLTITLNESEKNIDLNSITKVYFGKEQKNFYYLKISNSIITIELNKDEAKEFKRILKLYNINIKQNNLIDKILSWLGTKLPKQQKLD